MDDELRKAIEESLKSQQIEDSKRKDSKEEEKKETGNPSNMNEDDYLIQCMQRVEVKDHN